MEITPKCKKSGQTKITRWCRSEVSRKFWTKAALVVKRFFDLDTDIGKLLRGQDADRVGRESEELGVMCVLPE